MTATNLNAFNDMIQRDSIHAFLTLAFGKWQKNNRQIAKKRVNYQISRHASPFHDKEIQNKYCSWLNHGFPN